MSIRWDKKAGTGLTVVIGAQWGNEGKGKLVSHLCKDADVCARFNGGANNIHTLTIGGNGEVHIGRDSEILPKNPDGMKTLLLRLLPLGVINKSCQIVFGNGMVIHLPTLLTEIREIQNCLDKDILDRVFISTRAHLVFDFHLDMDHIFEALRGSKIGTTQKGIGPAYSTKTIRNGIRIGDLFSDPTSLHEKLSELVRYFEKYHAGLEVNAENVLSQTLSAFEILRPRVVDTVALMAKFIKENKRIICEGANSVMSDIDFGTYPYVTSSNTTPGAASLGLGIPPTKIGRVIGVCKSFTSRTQHWFPSVLDPNSSDTAEICRAIIQRGQEYGTTSNKPRRVGWLDLVQLKYSCDISGFDSLLLTKLDALSGLQRIGIVVGYKNWNVDEDGFPSSFEDYIQIVPEIEYMNGWAGSLGNIKTFSDLPENAKAFVSRIESFVKCPIDRIQLGAPETILTDTDIIEK
jgi:adenylosuccinate synthase